MNNLLLNVGSGQRPFSKPWINIDCQERFKPDILCDIKYLFPSILGYNSPGKPSESFAKTIVAHHVLEHFTLEDAIRALSCWYELLEKQGSLIISIPNIEALAIRYITKRIDSYTFKVNMMGAYMGDIADLHKWHWTLEDLEFELRKIGFAKVRLFDYREIEGADIAKDWWILCVEAFK